MQIVDLRQIHDSYDHVYLSPHLDDAALSCGGAIARHSSADARVLVVTICTAAPPLAGPFSSFARELHQKWGFPSSEAMIGRLNEDDLALERIGADTYRAGMLDAIYRMPEVYNSREAIFGTLAPADPLLSAMRQLITALHARMPSATFYAPLGVGNHVDHQIIYTAALDGAGAVMAFYEDFPYVSKPGALDQRMAALGQKFVASVLNIDATLTRKIGAIDAYASQLAEVFGDPTSMAQVVTEYAEMLRPDTGTYGERLWLRDAQ
jgi:LmbE family N-acetylglucosaminyl deacetylase